MSRLTQPRRIPPVLKLALGVLVLVGVGLLIKVLVSPGPPAPCTICTTPPKKVTLPGDPTFTSARYGFSFPYPAGLTTVSTSGHGVVGLEYGSGGSFQLQLLVGAGSGTGDLVSLIDDEANSLSGSEITDLQTTGPMHGAEIGFAQGEGEFYSGDYTDSVGDVIPVDIGIVAVQRSSGWVEFVGISVVSGSSSTASYFGVFDSILDEWRWT